MMTLAVKDRILKHRVPVVHAHENGYPAGVWDATNVEITDLELRQLRSYIAFVMTRCIYKESFGLEVLKKPLPFIDWMANTLVFAKSETGWSYRRASWTIGPYFVPGIDKGMPLADVIERAEDLIPERWVTWKAEHPEEFPA